MSKLLAYVRRHTGSSQTLLNHGKGESSRDNKDHVDPWGRDAEVTNFTFAEPKA